MRTITPAQAVILYELACDRLEELMRGDWEAVRQDVADLYELLAILARLQS
jgi:hypothetical protein